MSARRQSTDKSVALETARSRPHEDAPVLVLLGLVASDGSGELAFCSKGTYPPEGLLLDTSVAWAPDGDGEQVAPCPKCKQAPHWTIPFVRYVQEYDFDFGDGGISILPERFLAETITNLRTRAAKAVPR